MNRRQLIAGAAGWSLGSLAGPFVNRGWCAPLGDLGPRVTTRSIDLVQQAIVIDMLGLLSLDWTRLLAWLNHPQRFGLDDYWRLSASGIDVFHSAVEPAAKDPHRAARQWIAGWRRLLGNQPCSLQAVESVADLERSRADGPLGVMVGFQNSTHFRATEDVRWFYERGQRVSQLTYNARNELGSGCLVLWDQGLTTFGSRIVETMNEVGMVVDVSHCGERTSRDTIELSSKPVLITHANCRALVPSQRRNKSDEVIRAMARKGGVMGITMVRGFVSRGRATLDHVLDHIDHLARLVGVEHIGLGSDLDVEGRDHVTGKPLAPYVIAGLDPPLKVFQLVEGLVGRGYSRSSIEGILGANFRRVLGEIWIADAKRGRRARRDPFCPPPVPIHRSG